MISLLGGFAGARRGAALVEFTLIAPLLVLLMCGMAEFANAMRQYQIMEKGVRDAGRYVARVQVTNCIIPGSAVTAAQNLALTGRTSGGTPLLASWTNPSSVAVTVSSCVNNTSGAYRGVDNIPVIQVTATAPYADLGMLEVIGFGDVQLTVTHRQLWIGG